MNKLLFPLRYFWLVNREKRFIDIVPTAFITALLACPFLLFPSAPFFGQGGMLDKTFALTSAMAGFHIAALVAAATFHHEDLDRPIIVGRIFVRVRNSDGSVEEVDLTRRELACQIFGYLAFLCLALAITAVIVVPLSSSIATAIGADLRPYLRAIGILSLCVPIAHFIVVTGLGLYYLIDRIHFREPKVTSQKPRPKRAA